MRYSKLAFYAGFLITILTPTAAAEDARVTNAELGFSFTVPAGFHAAAQTIPNAVCTYTTTSGARIIFGIVRMHVILPKRGVDRSTIRKGLDVTMETTQWNGCEIDVCASTQTPPGSEKMFELDAMIPLKKEGVSLQVAGADKDRAAIRTQFNQILSTLQGETNWDSANGDSTGGREFASNDERRAYKIGEAVGYLLCALIGIFIIVKQ